MNSPDNYGVNAGDDNSFIICIFGNHYLYDQYGNNYLKTEM